MQIQKAYHIRKCIYPFSPSPLLIIEFFNNASNMIQAPILFIIIVDNSMNYYVRRILFFVMCLWATMEVLFIPRSGHFHDFICISCAGSMF